MFHFSLKKHYLKVSCYVFVIALLAGLLLSLDSAALSQEVQAAAPVPTTTPKASSTPTPMQTATPKPASSPRPNASPVAGVATPVPAKGGPQAGNQNFISTGDGNWFWLNPLPFGSTLNDISCISPNTCFAVGNGGAIFKSQDAGVSWIFQNSGVGEDLRSISCVSSTICFAGGDRNIVATRNGGASWQLIFNNPDYGSYNPAHGFYGVSCVDANTCFATGNDNDGGLMLSTTNGGQTWAIYKTGSPNRNTSISCGSATNCVVVGSSGDIFTTTNGGATWQLQQFPGFPSLWDVTCNTPTRCLAVGGSGTVLVSTDSGLTWTSQNFIDNTLNLHSITCLNISVCYAGGEAGIYYSANGGASWIMLISGLSHFTLSFGYNVGCVSLTNCAAVSEHGIWLTTNNGGTTWASYGSTATYETLEAISCPNITTCIVIGYYDNTILKTTDSGATWIPLNTGLSSNAHLITVNCPSTLICFVSSFYDSPSYGGILLKTTDGGTTWNTLTTPSNSSVNSISCLTITTCFMDAGNNILETNDGGLSWGISTTTYNLDGISCPDVKTCFTVGGGGLILATTDGGEIWQIQDAQKSYNLSSISCVSKTHCIAVGTPDFNDITGRGVILATTDGGLHWVHQDAGTPIYFGQISCVSTTTCFAVGQYAAIVTTNGGATWLPMRTGALSPIGITCVNANACFIVGYGGAILTNASISLRLPTLNQAFVPSNIPPGGVSALTFTLMNPNAVALTNLSFNDTLPAQIKIAPQPLIRNNCEDGSGQLSAAPGGSSLSVSGVKLDPGQTCTLSVEVTSNLLGSWNNTTGPLSAAETGVAATSNSATLNVINGLIVTTTADSASPPYPSGSLREVVNTAAGLSGGGTVIFDPALGLSPQINLAAALQVGSGVRIEGGSCASPVRLIATFPNAVRLSGKTTLQALQISSSASPALKATGNANHLLCTSVR